MQAARNVDPKVNDQQGKEKQATSDRGPLWPVISTACLFIYDQWIRQDASFYIIVSSSLVTLTFMWAFFAKKTFLTLKCLLTLTGFVDFLRAVTYYGCIHTINPADKNPVTNWFGDTGDSTGNRDAYLRMMLINIIWVVAYFVHKPSDSNDLKDQHVTKERTPMWPFIAALCLGAIKFVIPICEGRQLTYNVMHIFKFCAKLIIFWTIAPKNKVFVYLLLARAKNVVTSYVQGYSLTFRPWLWDSGYKLTVAQWTEWCGCKLEPVAFWKFHLVVCLVWFVAYYMYTETEASGDKPEAQDAAPQNDQPADPEV